MILSIAFGILVGYLLIVTFRIWFPILIALIGVAIVLAIAAVIFAA